VRSRLVPLASVGLVLVVLTVLTGCSGTSSTSANAASPVQTTQVDLPPSYQFSPTHIQVSRGATVTWTNHDNFSHSVQVQGQSEVHTMRPGESTQITFDSAGDFNYVCTFHTQNMKGTVSVS
jgi:plastocyanin